MRASFSFSVSGLASAAMGLSASPAAPIPAAPLKKSRRPRLLLGVSMLSSRSLHDTAISGTLANLVARAFLCRTSHTPAPAVHPPDRTTLPQLLRALPRINYHLLTIGERPM